MKQVIGILLMVSPFVLLTYFMVLDLGWIQSLAIWGGIAIMTGVIALGAWLAVG